MKISINKLQSLCALFALVFLIHHSSLLIERVSAIDLDPATGSCTAGQTLVINIDANPSGTSTIVQLGLDLTGPGSISYYTAPAGSSWNAPTAQCANNNTSSSTEICADLEKNTGNVTVGESLGSFGIYCTGTGTISIAAAGDNGYIVSGSLAPYASTSGTYTSTGTLPSTGILDDFRFLLIGGTLLAGGLLSWIYYDGFINKNGFYYKKNLKFFEDRVSNT
jgi:hypothetical protein